MAEIDNTQQTEGQQGEAQQQFDQEAFLQKINENIKQSLSEQQYQQQPQPVEQPQQQDEFGNYVRQYTNPAVQQANFAAAAAIDYTKFYTSNKVVKDGEEDFADGTISESMQTEIEKTFETMARQGRVASREEIRNYLLGREMTKKPEAFVEKAAKRKQQQLNKAQQGSDIGVASQVAAFTTDQLQAMSMDQLTKTMESVQF